MFTVWWLFAMLQGILLFAGIIGILVILEKILIERRSYGRWILPVVVLIFAVAIGTVKGVIHTSGPGGLSRDQIVLDNTPAGHIAIACDRDRNLLGFGRYMARTDGKIRAVDLVLQDGKVIRTGAPVSPAEKKAIEENFSYYKGTLSGNSLSYEEVSKLGEAGRYEKTERTLGSVFHGFMLYGGIPAMVLFAMALSDRARRKQKNAYNRTRLEDL